MAVTKSLSQIWDTATFEHAHGVELAGPGRSLISILPSLIPIVPHPLALLPPSDFSAVDTSFQGVISGGLAAFANFITGNKGPSILPTLNQLAPALPIQPTQISGGATWDFSTVSPLTSWGVSDQTFSQGQPWETWVEQSAQI